MMPPPAKEQATSPDKKGMQANETMEKMQPIEELAEKIRLKRILTRDEVNQLSIAVSREASESKSKYLI
jgi:hypothetical protein